ncbi:MAG: bifunctional UDP-N-acetylmuramoyl-L-alanyl-D-glutamate--2,6-diaminopimelate ligase MurE/UDP-N-acetylmuramoyl-tripeptide--D-alanyl-D-alanine ligase MurF [Caldimonas sp.]
MLESRDAAHAWLLLRQPRRLVGDSREVGDGDAFIAWPGHASDARAYVGEALAAGASACLVEADGVEAFAFGAGESRIAAMRGLKAAAGEIASRLLGTPSARLAVVAVTGTNGKTSTSWWVAQALAETGRRCAVVGTLGIGEPPRRQGAGGDDDGVAMRPTGLTTPDPIRLQAALAEFAAAGFAACAIEASSIGIVEHRLSGTRVAVAVFTNFTQDHLDYHGDMAAYWRAKAQLFAWTGLRAAVVNLDDAQGIELAATLGSGPVDVWTISARGAARLQATAIRHDGRGLAFLVHENGDSAAIETPLIGDYNVANLLCVVGVMRALGASLAEAATACAALTPVPGRMQRVAADGGDAGALPAGQPEVVVDYAHTPDALEKALAALRPLAAQRGGRLWCVFGCGGNRDAAKRPLMAAIAGRLADRTVVTSDNPRLEAPDFILSQILAGAVGHDEFDVIENRAEAIAHAVASAYAADVVLIAGKGHEETQDIGGVKLPFSDVEVAAAALRQRAAGAAAAARRPMATLAEAAAWLPGARLVGPGDTAFLRVHSDTRTIGAGDLFVALRGDRFDGNAFLAQARASGAVAALAERNLSDAGLPGLEVADARRALGQLAAAWRARFALPLVAVTGSNGKTTVTQMIAAIFRAWKGERAFATEGNFNNDIGVPLTLLRLRPAHAAAVVELGMNHPGEIASLAALAAPSVVLVNNAQREHLEFMATVEAVARENGTAIGALAADGVAVFPADDVHTATWREMAGARRCVTFAPDVDGAAAAVAAADVGGRADWLGEHWRVELRTPIGALAFDLHVPGLHNVHNAMAAAASALAAGCPLEPIGRGLGAFAAVGGRSQLRRIVQGGSPRTLVDDSYNANPDSVRAAIDVLAALPAPRWLILGDMGEVGSDGPSFHREAGAYASARGIESLWAAGPESASTVADAPGSRSFASVESLIAGLGAAPSFASVLVKGSRFMRMERVVAALAGEPARSDHAL